MISQNLILVNTDRRALIAANWHVAYKYRLIFYIFSNIIAVNLHPILRLDAARRDANMSAASKLAREGWPVSYTVISEGIEAPSATVVANALEALKLARYEARRSNSEIVISTETGWLLTLDELEELVKQ